MPPNKIQSDRVPALDITDEHIRQVFFEGIEHEKFRQRINNVVADILNSVPFMEKVMKYASQEIDNRLYKSMTFWLTLIFSSVLTTLVVNYLKSLTK